MRSLRTPEERFDGLDDFAFEPRYHEVRDGTEVRLHYLDEGPWDGTPILLLHGEPTWSYTFRHVIPPLVKAGLRCIVPDLVGFGRSDKPALVTDHSYRRQLAWIEQLFDALSPAHVTVVGHDWGGIVAIQLAMRRAVAVDGLVVCSTRFPTGDTAATPAVREWIDRSHSLGLEEIPAAVDAQTSRALTPSELTAYGAPFPDVAFASGPRTLPSLLPFESNDEAAGDARWAAGRLSEWSKPFSTVFGALDKYTRDAQDGYRETVPGAVDGLHEVIPGAGHNLQEDAPERLADLLAAAAQIPTAGATR